MQNDISKLKQIKQPVDLVLGYGLEQLRLENEIKRASLWNQIESSQTLIDKGYLIDQSQGSRDQTISEFVLAKLLLATAAKLNNEKTPVIKQFNDAELNLIIEFEKFNLFDILSVEEIADRMYRRKDLRDLALGFYQIEFRKADDLLESQNVRKDIKIALSLRYRDRLNKVVQGVQAFVSKYGIPDISG